MNHAKMIANAIQAGGVRKDTLIPEHFIGQKCINAHMSKMNHQDDFRGSLKKMISFRFQVLAFSVNRPARQQFAHPLLPLSFHPFHSLFLLSPSSFQPSLHPPSLLPMTFSDIYPSLLWHSKKKKNTATSIRERTDQ